MELIPKQILRDFLDILTRLGIDYALIGGLAAGIWSKERFTSDMDLTISIDQKTWAALEKKFAYLPDVNIKKIARDTGEVIPYLVRIDYKGYPIDLIASLTPYQDELLKNKLKSTLVGEDIYIAAPEDIIVLKLIANRSLDIVDIEKIIQYTAPLNIDYIQKWAKEWDVLDLWNKIVAKVKSP